jgi:hypothetical protein
LGNLIGTNINDGSQSQQKTSRQINHLYYGSGHLHQINLATSLQTVRGDKTSLYIYADSESYEPLARVDTLDGKENTIDSIAAQATNTPSSARNISKNSLDTRNNSSNASKPS